MKFIFIFYNETERRYKENETETSLV